MGSYTIRRKSFREVNRFNAIDEDGNHHVVVERVAILNDVGASGKVVESEQGALHFYSATSGDAVIQTADGLFVNKEGKNRLVLERSD